MPRSSGHHRRHSAMQGARGPRRAPRRTRRGYLPGQRASACTLHTAKPGRTAGIPFLHLRRCRGPVKNRPAPASRAITSRAASEDGRPTVLSLRYRRRPTAHICLPDGGYPVRLLRRASRSLLRDADGRPVAVAVSVVVARRRVAELGLGDAGDGEAGLPLVRGELARVHEAGPVGLGRARARQR
jgi:hypothetical protein